ncbi:hypothetical protein [Haloprofundus salinisoli]|uniref:hypothetical protein n=1 Tax=Haloprofundus salinisoli TaxID=2876193 RepID=UPI001CCA1E6E|nr:hypothetical protein [Haloprofundus salinisoli]
MPIRKLSNRAGTPTISLDKGDLALDGIMDEDGTIPDCQMMHLQRMGEGVYVVRAIPDGHEDLKPLRETEMVQGLAAMKLHQEQQRTEEKVSKRLEAGAQL